MNRRTDADLSDLSKEEIDGLIKLAQHYLAAAEAPDIKQDALRDIAQRIKDTFSRNPTKTPPDPRMAAIRQAVKLWESDSDPLAVAAILRDVFIPDKPPRPRQIAEFWNQREPEAVLWHDSMEDSVNDQGAPLHSVLAVGEIAVLAGAGGSGKSILGLALAAAAASRNRRDYAPVCGLRVRGGGSVIFSYEDSPVRIAHRLKRASQGNTDLCSEMNLRVVDPTLPLFPMGADPERPREHARATFWDALWTGVRNIQPSLVVVDTGPKAMGGVADYSPGPIIAFYQALEQEAQAAGFGVLIIAHDTKAARGSIDPGAGAIAGSHQWHDCARGALHLAPDPEDPDSSLLLQCVKSNHGPRGWGARLGRATGTKGEFLGLELLECLNATGMRLARGNGGSKNSHSKARRAGAQSEDREPPDYEADEALEVFGPAM